MSPMREPRIICTVYMTGWRFLDDFAWFLADRSLRLLCECVHQNCFVISKRRECLTSHNDAEVADLISGPLLSTLSLEARPVVLEASKYPALSLAQVTSYLWEKSTTATAASQIGRTSLVATCENRGLSAVSVRRSYRQGVGN